MRRGSRPLALAGRALLWAALGLVLVRGGLDLFRPDASEATPTAEGRSDDESTVDVDAAQAFAVRFASDFLTLDADDPRRRLGALETYVAPGVDLDGVWEGDGVQAVLDAVPVSATVADGGRMSVLVAVQVDPARWLHLAVPVAGQDGQFVVTGLPALVAAPPAASVELAEVEIDAELSTRLRPTVESFFAAYGAAQQEELDRYLLPGRSLPGLAGEFVVDDVREVTVVAADANATQRLARATVRWLDPASGTGFSASYDLGLVEEDGRWYVERLTAAQA